MTKVSKPKTSAGGLPALLSSFEHVQNEVGLVRGMKTLLRVNQPEGFDCPGCAWPEPEDRHAVFEFCENGVKAIAEEATTKRISSEFFANWSVQALAEQTDYWLGKQGRLTQPMWKKSGASHYEECSWERAFEVIASALKGLQSPDQAVFYTSGRTSNEAAFLYQLFVRAFGTNNLPDCSNMCHESSGVALKETIGIGKGTVSLADFELADCVLVVGQNPGTNHPRMMNALQKAARNGARIISINPLAEAGLSQFDNPKEVSGLLGLGTPLASLHLPVRINGDVALFKGILKEMLRLDEASGGNVFDRAFIEEYTVGFEDFIADLRTTPWDEICRSSGIEKAQIEAAAGILAGSKRLIACWAMGLTQHENAVANIQEVVNLLCLGGHLGRPGAGACPVRGHSNVQGDRTMGIYEKMPESFMQRLGEEFQFSPPRHHGMDTVESIQAMLRGDVKVFFGMGGNFAAATPDTEVTAKALAKCRLTVQVSTKLNRSHAVTGEEAIILPCLGRTEVDLQASAPQFVTTENSMGIVQKSLGNLPPASKQLKSEARIVAELAVATLGQGTIPWLEMAGNYDLIRDRIEKVIPGFEAYNERIKKHNAFALPNPVRDRRKFDTASGRAEFTVHPIPNDPAGAGQYLLMTLRSHDQYNTTVYGLQDRYRGIADGRRVLFINALDLADAGFEAGAWVDITSHHQGQERVVRKFKLVPYSIPRRCLAAYFPETNGLVPLESVAKKSNTPTYKSILVSLSHCSA